MNTPKFPARLAVAVGAIAFTSGLAGCITIESHADGEAEETAQSTVAAEETADPAGEAGDTAIGLEVLVGSWEAAYEDVGPHGSTLTVEADGTASWRSSASQRGAFEGEIVLGAAEPHRFEGVVGETGTEAVLELEYDAEADVLLLTNVTPGLEGETIEHTRAE